MPDKTINLQFSLQTLLKIFLFGAGLYVVYRLQAIIILLFVSWLFASAINPLISWGERHSLPRGVSLTAIFIIFVIVLVSAIASIVPPLVVEISSLIQQIELPPVITTRLSEYNLQELEILARQLTSLPRFAGAIVTTFSSFLFLFTFSIITYYLVIERPYMHRHLIQFFGRNHDQTEIEIFINRFESQVGGWIRGELCLMVIIGFMTYIALSLLGIDYALPLAILAGLLEIVPNIGPTIAAIPAILIATITYSVPMGLIVMGVYVLIQQIENNLIVPKIMRKTTGLHPLVTILLIIIGLELGGMIGAILSIPIFLAIKVGIQEWSKMKRPGDAITNTLKQFKS